jgi:hypothetical protein
MLGTDLAALYEVPTRVLNQAVGASGHQNSGHCRKKYDELASLLGIVIPRKKRKNFYLGPLQIYTQGFHDAQNGSLITKELRTDWINAGTIVRGEVPGWKKLDVTRNRLTFQPQRQAILVFPKNLGFGRLMVHNTFEYSEKTSSRKALQHLKFHHVSVSGCMKLHFPSNSTRITSSIKVSCS